MTFEFIKSLENVKHGATYYQDNTGKIEIGCYELGLKITDYENLVYYYRKANNETSLTLFKNILEENPIKNISELIKFYLLMKNIQNIHLKKIRFLIHLLKRYKEN